MATITWMSGASFDWDLVANWSMAPPGSASAPHAPATSDLAALLRPDVVPAGLNPLLHYVLTGEGAGWLPSERVHPAWYRRRHKLGVSESPLAHYLAHRYGQQVSPLPAFDDTAYTAAHAATLRPGRDPFLHSLPPRQSSTLPLKLAA